MSRLDAMIQFSGLYESELLVALMLERWAHSRADDGNRTHSLESESEMILAISALPTTIYRLYYDEFDSGLVNRLRTDGWLHAPQNSSESEERS